MSDSFTDCLAIEQRAMAELVPFYRMFARDGERWCVTDKGALSKLLQAEIGDVVMNTHDGKVWGVELKAEEENAHGNFFFEDWSNKVFDPGLGMSRKVGWMATLKSDILLYYFLREGTLYSIDFRKLWDWFWCRPSKCGYQGRFRDFPERTQKKNGQKNVTAGICVPIETVRIEVGFRRYLRQPDGTFSERI